MDMLRFFEFNLHILTSALSADRAWIQQQQTEHGYFHIIILGNLFKR